MTQDKPLFVPLRTKWFEAFAAGTKHDEWRRYGPGWNERTCRVGRPVTLSRGYGKAHRLHGIITSFHTEAAVGGAAELYGEGTRCAVIGIKMLAQAPPHRHSQMGPKGPAVYIIVTALC